MILAKADEMYTRQKWMNKARAIWGTVYCQTTAYNTDNPLYCQATPMAKTEILPPPKYLFTEV